MLNVAVKLFNGLGCTQEDGCSIFFDKDATFHYFPSNVSNYFITLNGTINFDYSDGSSLTSVPIYNSNSWSDYQDVWRYDVSFDAKINRYSYFLSMSLLNNTTTTANSTLKIKKIENETFSFSTGNSSVLFVYGLDYQYNGNTVNSNGVNKISAYGNKSGNTKTHEIIATTPLTLIFLEKQ